MIVMFNFKCVAQQSSNRKQRKTSERFSRRGCVDGAIFSSNPMSFLFKRRLSRGVTAKAVQLGLVVCLAAVACCFRRTGELLKRVITKRRSKPVKTSVSLRLRWNHVGLHPLDPLKMPLLVFPLRPSSEMIPIHSDSSRA